MTAATLLEQPAVTTPAAAPLSQLIASGLNVTTQLRTTALHLAEMHARCPGGPAQPGAGLASTLCEQWVELCEQVRWYETDVADGELSDVLSLASAYVATHAELFDHREKTGQVVRRLGDLTAADVWCFDARIGIAGEAWLQDEPRYGDVLMDVGSLALDLELRGRADLARAFVDMYRDASGIAHPEGLLQHCIANRALQRCADICRLQEPGSRTLAQARRLLHVSALHLRASEQGGLDNLARPA